MEKLSKETILKKHRELWYKIAEIMERDDFDLKNFQTESGFTDMNLIKEKAFDELNVNRIPCCGCWCCEYDEYFDDDCTHCPIEWKTGSCGYSEFGEVVRACDKNKKDEAIMWAKKIANLPEREDMDDE